MDFVRCRYFRKSLVCRGAVRLNRTLTPAVVRELLLASDAAPAAASNETHTFRTPAGHTITCRSPATKAAIEALRAAWPMPIAFGELVRQAGGGDEAAAEFLAGEMLTCMAAGVVEWRLTPVPFTTTVEKKPAATPLARYQAERGYKVTNMRGETITLDEMHRQTLKALDGSRDVAALTKALMGALTRGELVLQRDEDKSTVKDETEMQRLLGPAIEKVLANLARRALLQAARA